MEKIYTKKSSNVKEFLRIYFLSFPLWQTKRFKERVLDLGCGWGFYFKINPFAYGIDFNANCVRYLKSLGYKVIQEDIRNQLSFRGDFFKCVICHDVLEHMELKDIEKIFLRVHDILEPQGIFLILIPNRKGFEYGLKLNVGHKYFITPEEIFLITKGKFAVEKHYSYPLPRFVGRYFAHNKEVIILKKLRCQR